MGLFKKKADPISERAKELNRQIAALEAEIHKLSNGKNEHAEESALIFKQPDEPRQAPTPPPGEKVRQQPRLRSTAVPFAATQAAPVPQAAKPEPVFEELALEKLKNKEEPAPPEHYNELGVRKYDLPALWKRLKSNFRGPATSNPKLVNYLAAGSIQGLRPLRYEKRVARNRFIVLVVVLILVLWGVIAVFIKRS